MIGILISLDDLDQVLWPLSKFTRVMAVIRCAIPA
jgi:hypothetical protein